jgi:hypothetical protein
MNLQRESSNTKQMAVLYQLNDHRIAAAWGVVKALIAKVCYKCTYWKKVKGSCRAAAWASAWQGGGSIDERFVLFAQSDGTNHAEELLLQRLSLRTPRRILTTCTSIFHRVQASGAGTTAWTSYSTGARAIRRRPALSGLL